MRRREFIAGLGSVATWPVVAQAQQVDRVWRIGALIGGGLDENDRKLRVSAFTKALADLGWIDGRNARMDLRWGGGDINQLRTLAQELVGLQPDVIVTSSTAATAAAQRETRTIPIVFVNVADPVATGMVARLDRPNGNLTGFVNFETSLGGKWLELLSEIAPRLKRAAIMVCTSVRASRKSRNRKVRRRHCAKDRRSEGVWSSEGRRPIRYSRMDKARVG